MDQPVLEPFKSGTMFSRLFTASHRMPPSPLGHPSVASVSDYAELLRDYTECGADLLSKERDRGYADHGDQADQQAILDQGGALLVLTKAVEELAHTRFL